MRGLAGSPNADLLCEPCSVQPWLLIPQAGRGESSVGKVMAPPNASSIRCHCRSGLKVPQGSGRCSERDKPFHHGPEEQSRKACLHSSDSPFRGLLLHREKKGRAMVFVLDQKKQPLMPCTPKRARLLLQRGRAVVHRVQPFVIRLKDRRVQDSILQPLALKIDPGSKTSGITLARVQETEEGALHLGVFLGEVRHRGAQVHEHKVRQRNARRRRRSANLRHRAPRFANRGIPAGWLAPSSPGWAIPSPGPRGSPSGLPSAGSRSSRCASTPSCCRIPRSRGPTISKGRLPDGKPEPTCW